MSRESIDTCNIFQNIVAMKYTQYTNMHAHTSTYKYTKSDTLDDVRERGKGGVAGKEW